jgi:hypothetical protein
MNPEGMPEKNSFILIVSGNLKECNRSNIPDSGSIVPWKALSRIAPRNPACDFGVHRALCRD